ncbi:S-norcoclaurine synthase 1-like [Gossypium raimondii]|uniref:S-norcoclaurine synthase 1-like n=1 Tax=Gossypium raimondii TaxID=29730 RepID=UPI00227D1682|nr:S-norcoclaurine synthase 1-like [Gossypium raimondii]
METKVVSRAFAGSLPVDSVQALASKNLKNIPSRYIRPEIEFEVVPIDESHGSSLLTLKQLINHGIADELIEKMKIDTQEFFKFPLEEKMAYAQLPNEIEGYGQTLVRSVDQKLDWNDMLCLFPLPVPLRNIRLWPTNPPSFR